MAFSMVPSDPRSVRAIEQLSGFGNLDADELLERHLPRRVLDVMLLDERRRGSPGGHRRELRLRVGDRLVHLLDRFEQRLFDHPSQRTQARNAPPTPGHAPRIGAVTAVRRVIKRSRPCGPRGCSRRLPGFGHVEDHDRDVVVTAERDRGGVHHPEILRHHLGITDLVVLRGGPFVRGSASYTPSTPFWVPLSSASA